MQITGNFHGMPGSDRCQEYRGAGLWDGLATRRSARIQYGRKIVVYFAWDVRGTLPRELRDDHHSRDCERAGKERGARPVNPARAHTADLRKRQLLKLTVYESGQRVSENACLFQGDHGVVG